MSIQGKRSWFTEARLGVFAHFGLYSLLGGNENAVRKGSKKKYANLMHKFNPSRFNASQWVSQVKDSGAQYLVLTAKHAEGFCLWDSQHTPYKSTNTPCKRDLVAELAQACDKQKLRLGLYYNCNTWLNERADGKEHDKSSYPDFVEAQLRELLTGYGPIHLIWFDHRDPLLPLAAMRHLKQMIHDLQPTAVVNDRGVRNNKHPGLYLGDYVTPERHIPDTLDDNAPFVECCDAMGVRSWGYHKDERFWSVPELTRRLSKTASLGANYLLNIEPQPDGRIRPECVQRLRKLGQWVHTHTQAIFQTQGCPLTVVDPSQAEHPKLGTATTRGKDIFLHLHKWPAADWILVPGLKGKPASVRLLGKKNTLTTAYQKEQTSSSTGGFIPSGLQVIGLPDAPPSSHVSVIELTYKQTPKIDLATSTHSQKHISAPPNHTVYLQPETAQCHAKGGVPWHTINRFANGNTSIGHIIRAGCEIRWHLNIQADTTYEVFVDLGTIASQADARFSISVGKERIDGVTVDEGCWYDTPVRMQVGTLSINKGKRTLILRVLEMPKAFSDVHSIILQPVST